MSFVLQGLGRHSGHGHAYAMNFSLCTGMLAPCENAPSRSANYKMNIRKILANTGLIVLLASCSSMSTVSSAGAGPGLWLVPVNHTDRYAPSIFVEDAWAGNVGPQGGGGGAVCCIAGRKDWSKPALVKWRWGAEEDPVTKAITFSGEDHSAMVSFPGAPKRLNKSIKDKWSAEDYMADEAYLCVIFRSVNKVEFAYSSTGGGCRQK